MAFRCPPCRGNLLQSGAGANVYDFENRLVQRGGVTLVYDGDGNRVKESVAGVATSYLVADQNLTGYAQVMDELQGGTVSRSYTYGLSLINQRLTANGQGLSFFGFDGHGSVRYLTSSTGVVTDTYDYDAFGNLISSTGSTPNNYLFAGEQFDPALGIYYNRARYYDQRQGRFWTMDTWEGDPQTPGSLHKYLYAGANSPNNLDPSGHDFDLGSVTSALGSISTLAATALVAAQNVLNVVYYNLYRVPQVIDSVSTWLLNAQGTVAIGTIAASTIEQMASNLQSSTQPLPAGGGPMGDQVENIAPGNLVRNTKSYDYFDPDNQIAGQIQGTRAISSAQSLMSVIQRGLGKLNSAPEVVNSRFRDGGTARIVKSDLNVRFLIQGIPSKPVGWDFRAFMQQVEMLEETERMIIKIVPMQTLD